MKKVLFLAVFSVLSLAVFAQNAERFEDVVYLKNGSVYRGLIIEQIPNVSLKIQSGDRNVFAVQLSDVEKITKEEKPNDFYRNGYFKNGIDKPNLEEHKERKPTKLGGAYLNWGLGVGASGVNGFSLEMTAGGKIFSQKAKESHKKAIVGVDVFGFIGGTFTGIGNAGNFGVNVGPTIAWKLREARRGIIFLTPYSGINVSHGYYNDWAFYDQNTGYYYSNTYQFTTFTFPVGIKFEYQYKKFFCGVNANLALGVGTQDGTYQGLAASGRLMFFVGVKF